MVSVSLNRGIIRTPLTRNLSGSEVWLSYLLGNPADPMGAVTQLYAGTAPEAERLGGGYMIPWASGGEGGYAG